MFKTAAEWHAALNDLPAALLVGSVVFDLLGTALKRDSLKAAGFWSLVAGVVGAGAAVTTGLIAAGRIEHGETVHLIMKRHETWAISLSVCFALLAAWRIARRGLLGPQEWPTYLFGASLGALGIIYVAHLGGTIVFRHAAGVPTPALEEALHERSEGHHHEPGEEHDEADEHANPPVENATRPDSAAGAATHTHPPGTPPHRH